MAYDGFVVAATVEELNRKLSGGSIVKVAQPEKDELLFTVKANRQQVKLLLSANASLPVVCLKEDHSLAPVTAPAFCMSLRKHIGSGRILKVEQAPGFERVIIFTIEHLDEMGDRGEKKLICELMGRHSNIILTRPDLTVIDSIRHITAQTSSLREVLPGRQYFLPETRHCGYGKAMDQELLFRAGIDPRIPKEERTPEQNARLAAETEKLEKAAAAGNFEPNIIFEGKQAVEFSAFRMQSLSGDRFRADVRESMSEVVAEFYGARELQNRIRAKSEDIRLLLKNLTERTAKKLDLQEKQYADAADREKYRIRGELLTVYGYGLQGGEKFLDCENYYDENRILRIPLDEHKNAQENAKAYFDRYQKLKRTAQALETQIRENRETLYHLDTLKNALLLSENDADLREIRREMEEAGYIRRGAGTKKEKTRKEEQRSAPLKFVSSDGLEILVGRNNAQNEELDFRVSSPDDYWFHAKKIPGSHVIVRTGKGELPERTCLEAASLAAYYSKAGREGISGLIEVDYVRRRELKKVPGAQAGFVIYHTNRSVLAEPEPEIG